MMRPATPCDTPGESHAHPERDPQAYDCWGPHRSSYLPSCVHCGGHVRLVRWIHTISRKNNSRIVMKVMSGASGVDITQTGCSATRCGFHASFHYTS
ncbi:hypothetical protein GDO81_022632 [Engystomops pustulosus]|uniref:Uncharacterized protein n=1 Tax=Engystomops pustulosus TaxID=76066 RepID=A0AAV6YLY2_ENGPU|nr:hypothetical protein GDO81_022632 [Engystomops pustulosus]